MPGPKPADPQWPEALGWIDVPPERAKPGRYFLLANFEWAGPDEETAELLTAGYSYSLFPGHGGMRPGAAQIAAAVEEMKLTSYQIGPPDPKPDPEGTVY